MPQLILIGVVIVGGWYMMAGLIAMALTDNRSAFSPWTMALIFAPGQFLAAGVLWWTLERRQNEEGRIDGQEKDKFAGAR